MNEKPARVLAARYELDAVLGEGGMAKVFRGTDRVLGRTVAVKVLASRFADDDRTVRRFQREARSAASLNHPNVVSVFDTGSEDGIHWIVMEFVEGRTLKDVIAEEGSVSSERAVEIAQAVALALAAAHEQGMVHRDVKPANIMLTNDDETKVVDFGIARLLEAGDDATLTKSGFVVGTAAYLSPEQAQGRPVDARSDIYSLGCVLYEMLTGRPPFLGENAVAVASRHISDAPEPVSRLNPDVPRSLETVVARSLAKRPEDRYQEARTMAEDLRRATGVGPEADDTLAGAPTERITRERTRVLPEAVPEPVRERFRERPWLPAVLLGGFLVILAVLAAALLLSRGTETPGETPASPQPPAESPTEAPPDLAAAIAAFRQAVEDGAAAGEISEEAREELLDKFDDAVEKFGEGKGDEAIAKLDEVHQKVDEFVEKGEVAEGRAATLHAALDDVQRAMLESAPSEGEGEGNGNQGHGNGGGGDGSGDQGRGGGNGGD